MNLCVFQGRLTANPEIRATAAGSQVVNFSIAVNRRYQEKNETTFLNFEAWGTTAEFIARHFEKGDPILITNSEVRVDSWTDSNDIKRSKVRFRANTVEFTLAKGRKEESAVTSEEEKPAPSPKPAKKTAPKRQPSPPVVDDDESAEDDDIPF